jgi:endoplasmic reticulum junction formation protein lunapark
MSFLTGWFRRTPKEEDYESVLQNLALSISRRQSQLSEIRLRERRTTLLVTLYAFAAYVAYGSLWYYGFVNNKQTEGVGRALRAAPLILGPVV